MHLISFLKTMPFELSTHFSLKRYLLLTYSSFIFIHFNFLFEKQFFFRYKLLSLNNNYTGFDLTYQK